MNLVHVNEHFQADYYNSACTTWTDLDPHQFLSSHATRQGEYVVLDDMGNEQGIACRHCARVLRGEEA